MMNRLRFFKRLAVDLPRQVRLAYCLMRDARVPVRTKIAFGAGIAVIVTPFVDLPAAIPVVGELDVLALSLLALRLFIAACPDDVVGDVEQQILEGRSVFDEDLRAGERIATMLSRRFDHSGAAPEHHVYDSEPVPPPVEHTGVGA
jgi:uncharacterized membrane protein YkvA (DUF1232 family)